MIWECHIKRQPSWNTGHSHQVFWCRKAQGHHQGIRQWHRLHPSTWISDFIMTWGSSMDHRYQDGLGGILGFRDLLRSPIQTVKLSTSQASIVDQSQKHPAARWKVVGWVCVCLSSRTLCTIRLILLGNGSELTSALSLSPVTAIKSPVGLVSIVLESYFLTAVIWNTGKI